MAQGKTLSRVHVTMDDKGAFQYALKSECRGLDDKVAERSSVRTRDLSP